MLLAFETATNVCSVALKDRAGQIHEKRIERRGSHSEQLFLFVEELMKEQEFSISELDAVLISQGPGSYTGLRIGASAVKGLLFQTNVSLYAVDTLAGFARGALEHTKSDPPKIIHAVIDARRVHLYHQKFKVEQDRLEALSEVEIKPLEHVEGLIKAGHAVVGTGLDRLDQTLFQDTIFLGPAKISASSLIALFERDEDAFYRQVAPQDFDPQYYTSRQVEK